jgi:hypothetical protein
VAHELRNVATVRLELTLPSRGWEPPPSWLDVIVNIVVERFGFDPEAVETELDEITADPIGDPVQVVNVHWDAPETWTASWEVNWDIIGDEITVESFLVEVLAFRPHALDPVGGVVGEAVVAAGLREVSIVSDPSVVAAELGSDPTSVYFIARVCPLTDSGTAAGSGQFGPATPAVISHQPIITMNPLLFIHRRWRHASQRRHHA